jgi:hypothetical protein
MEQDKTIQSELMRLHISACKESKMKVEAYCSEHKIKPSNYYYWKKKLHQKDSPGKFIPITPLTSNAPVSITFSNGNRIFFEAMPAPDYLKQLVS